MMKLKILDNEYAICRLNSDSKVPAWALQSSFFSICRTANELSVVCEKRLVPTEVKSELGWRILGVEGTLNFSLTGILSSIVNPLAMAKISVFAISTFDTDYILVKQGSLEEACSVLQASGFMITKNAL